MEQPEIKVGFVQTKSIMTKSNAPLGGYSVNPYVGCPHACRYCYASFMKRFTGHTEDWGTFMDVKARHYQSPEVCRSEGDRRDGDRRI